MTQHSNIEIVILKNYQVFDINTSKTNFCFDIFRNFKIDVPKKVFIHSYTYFDQTSILWHLGRLKIYFSTYFTDFVYSMCHWECVLSLYKYKVIERSSGRHIFNGCHNEVNVFEVAFDFQIAAPVQGKPNAPLKNGDFGNEHGMTDHIVRK